jgi:Sensors of blue-light using FAD
MYHLVYISYATSPFSEAELVNLLQQCREANKAQGITGMLIYLQERFIQVLEGDRSTIKRLYTKIEKDARHQKVSVLLEGESEERIFKNWSMGFKNLSLTDFNELSGFQDIDAFFKKENISNESSATLIFLKLFYKKNINDYPEPIEY